MLKRADHHMYQKKKVIIKKFFYHKNRHIACFYLKRLPIERRVPRGGIQVLSAYCSGFGRTWLCTASPAWLLSFGIGNGNFTKAFSVLAVAQS